MKTSLQNNPRRAKKAWLIIFAIIIITGATNNNARLVISRSVLLVSLPFFNAENFISNKLVKTVVLFRSKKNVIKELSETKERVAEIEMFLMETEILKKENEELKTLLSRSDKKSYILGSIISRPPKSPYDIIIIDAGTENGVENGMRILAYSNVFIGYIVETAPKYSKAKLVSFPGEEIGVSVVADTGNVSATAIGMGGGNVEIRLPGSVKIIQNGKITTEETFPLVIGESDTIESDANSPFQKIKFRLPINLNEIKNVFVEK